MRRLFALAAVAALVLVGCGGGSSNNTDPLAGGDATGADAHAGHSDDAAGAAATCEPSGPALTITAKDTAFNKACLAAPAGQAFTIKFDNNDALPHNVTIRTSHEATSDLFSGELLTGPNKSTTYKIGAMAAGTYHFHCTVHPDVMNGTFVVK
jgi:plastocyanin